MEPTKIITTGDIENIVTVLMGLKLAIEDMDNQLKDMNERLKKIEHEVKMIF
jgi:hypothetical protein